MGGKTSLLLAVFWCLSPHSYWPGEISRNFLRETAISLAQLFVAVLKVRFFRVGGRYYGRKNPPLLFYPSLFLPFSNQRNFLEFSGVTWVFCGRTFRGLS